MYSVAEMEKGYPVEVSGWDANDNFFVEKTVLEWKEDGLKTIDLHCAMRVGCVLFIRLLQSAPIGSTFPIAYEAASVAKTGDNSTVQVSLNQLQPRVASLGETYRERSTTTRMA
jgi:hypothetical protein